MWVWTLFFVLPFFVTSHGAKILAVFMTPSYSHQIVYQPIWRELSLRGHQVTVYTPNPLNDKSLTNLTEYDLGFSYEVLKDHHFEDTKSPSENLKKVLECYKKVFENQMSHKYLQDLIKNVNNETYDLFLVEYIWQSYYAIKEIYNVPMIGLTSLPLTLLASDSLGMDKHPVLDPDIFVQFSFAETLKQRVFSWAYNWIYRIIVKPRWLGQFNAEIKKYFGERIKDVRQLAQEVSLVIGNYNFALQNIKPITPKYVPVSSLHVRPRKALPTDLAQFMDNLKNDVIYFSLGTNVKSSQVSKEKIQQILNVLGRLPYTILWKYETKNLPPNLPKNIIVRKWFPQQDLLGHPKVKLFITQAGIQSLDESILREVPMLIIPFLFDQKINADKCVKLGIAESINFADFTEDELETKINKLLNDQLYRKNIKEQARIITDQPMSSVDTAVYWIEYVIRHKGASHLRYKSVDIPFYQYYMLDVYLFVALISSLLFYILKRIAVIVALSYTAFKKLIVAKIFNWRYTEEKKIK
uniref:UDP-glucuronosyltransferase n=1 Tax=Lissorhoptrus oryzophilus TaxID=308863 RepID=A0A2R4FXI3_9CUCU|nr:UDP-glucuronosyltransferase 321G1 [Lissorhoptrus oryzophilus]